MGGFVAIICGLKSEADVLRSVAGSASFQIDVSGADASRAQEIAQKFCEAGASAVVSAGISGALDPALKPGALIIGARVVDADRAVGESDIYLMRAIRKHAEKRGAVIDSLFGSDFVVQTADEKAALREKYDCVAVDMESHGAARAAGVAGVPFIAIRAIADPAQRALPPAALGAVAPNGTTRVAATLGAALRNPQQFPALVRLGADSHAALQTLRRDAGALLSAIARAVR